AYERHRIRMQRRSYNFTFFSGVNRLVISQNFGDDSIVAAMVIPSGWTLPGNSAEFVASIGVVYRRAESRTDPFRSRVRKNFAARENELGTVSFHTTLCDYVRESGQNAGVSANHVRRHFLELPKQRFR